MLHTQTLFLGTKSLKITFAAPMESFGGLTGALLCLECGDLAVYHSWWMRLLLLSGEEGHWEPALSCQGFSLRKWTESIKNSEVASPEAASPKQKEQLPLLLFLLLPPCHVKAAGAAARAQLQRHPSIASTKQLSLQLPAAGSALWMS